MANKHTPEKWDKTKKKISNSGSQSATLLQQGSELEHVNGYNDPSTSHSSPGCLETPILNQISDENGEVEEFLFNPNQNGLHLSHRSENGSGAVPKSSLLKNLKKLKVVNGASNGETFKSNFGKKGKKTKRHNSACCDIFCGHPEECKDDSPFHDPNIAHDQNVNFGWNDVNGGGINGFINPNLALNPETENVVERNCVSVENLNVSGSEDRFDRNGCMSRDVSEGSLSEMIDEGAVCDFDRLQLQEFEEMYEIENVDIDNDNEFDELESPDLLLTYSENCKVSEPSHAYRHVTRYNHFPNCVNVFPRCSPEMSGASAQTASNYQTNLRYGNPLVPDNLEDDFIDTDLPSKASGRNSSESFSGSDEEASREQFEETTSDYCNDLSGARNSRCLSMSSENSSPGPENNLISVNCGSNIDLNKDESLYPADKLHLLSHDDCDNSSESENGDNIDDISHEFHSINLAELCSGDNVTSFSHGAVGHFNRPCFSDEGMNASGGSPLCEKVSNAEFPVCNCLGMNNTCLSHSSSWNQVNDLSSVVSSRNSNFKSDESNKKQKIFNKFPVLGSRQSCGSQAAQTHGCNSQSCDQPVNLQCVSMSDSDQSSFHRPRRLFLHANCEHTTSTAECGVSEPIYEDIEDCNEDTGASKTGASGGSTDIFRNNLDSDLIQDGYKQSKKSSRLRPSKITGCFAEKVMIWSEYEANIQQVQQIGTSACGPTAVINVLKALDSKVDKEEVSRVIRAKLRMEDAPIPLYLFSRAVAGTEACDLLQGVETLTHGKLKGRFFKFWPPREVHLVKWLGYWMKKGAVPLATLNLQLAVPQDQQIPDAWHHQMVYGVSSKDVYLTNPQERVSEKVIMEQLTSDSVLLVNRKDIVNRFQDNSDLRELLVQSDERWCTMNVLGQVVNVLREESLVKPGYRTQLTSHVEIPAVYETGVTLFVHSNTETWTELQSVGELPYKSTPISS